MEPVRGINNASKIASQEEEDVIIRMPENVITNILNRLPLKNSVGTSILSRNWRFNWTLLTQLVFDLRFFCFLAREEDKDYDWRIIISRLLIHLKGPITKFILDIPYGMELLVEDINHWVMFLSRKGIKDFTLNNWHETPLSLPTHLFSCLELRHLELYNCSFQLPPTFCGFPNLLRLDLSEVTYIDHCVEFFTNCPSLEILNIMYYKPIRKLKLVEIAKLRNLKELCLSLYMLDDVAITSSTIFQLGSYLPKLQDLTLEFEECKFIGEGERDTGARKSVYTIFPCLKTLLLCGMDLNNGSMLSCATVMIWGSPNLQKLSIIHQDKNEDDDPPPVLAADNGVGFPPSVFCFPEVDNNIKLQLQSVDFNRLRGSENEVYMIKTLLACSPFLHRMTIRTKSSQVSGDDNRKLMLALKLSELNRASPIAKVKLRFKYP